MAAHLRSNWGGSLQEKISSKECWFDCECLLTLTRANILAILFFIVSLSAVVPLYAQDGLRAFTANLSITKEGVSQTGKIYSDGGHAVRMELSSPGSAQDQIIILYLDSDTKQRLNPRGDISI